MGAVRLIAAMPAHLHTCRVGSSYLGILYSYTVAITPQRGHGSGIIASSAGPSRAQIQVASCNPSPPFAATSAPWSRPATTPRSTPITTRWNSGTGPIPKIRARRISRRPTRARCSTIPWSRSGRRRLSARLDRGQPGLVPRPSGAGQFLFWPRRRHPGIRLGRQRDAGPLAGRRPGLRTRRRRAGAGDGAVAAPDRGLRDDDADVRAFPGTILAAPAVPGQRAGNHHARGHRRAGHDGRRAGPSGRAGRATPDA